MVRSSSWQTFKTWFQRIESLDRNTETFIHGVPSTWSDGTGSNYKGRIFPPVNSWFRKDSWPANERGGKVNGGRTGKLKCKCRWLLMLIWGWELDRSQPEAIVAAMAGRVWFMYSRTKENAPKLRQLCANACGVPGIAQHINSETAVSKEAHKLKMMVRWWI